MGDFVERRRLGRVGLENRMRLAEHRRHRLPDVYFLSNEQFGIRRKARLEGAADLVVEVVSESDPEHDYVTKFREYEAAGVREYWIVDPGNKAAVAYRLVDGAFVRIDRVDGRIHSAVLAGFWLRPADLFTDPRPAVMDVLAEIEATPATPPTPST